MAECKIYVEEAMNIVGVGPRRAGYGDGDVWGARVPMTSGG